MKVSTVSARGLTVIPVEIREQLGIRPHTKLVWSTRNGMIIVVPISEDPIEASFGMLAGRGYTLEDFLEERQKERELDKLRETRLERQARRATRKRKA
jgi:AbrB family looped-hinge helix DNA binding protein